VVDVISLAGTSGVGEDTATHGLGPTGTPIPPPPPPPPHKKHKKSSGGVEEADRLWRARWRRILGEDEIPTGEQLAKTPRGQPIEELEWLDETTLAEADYFIVAAGDEAVIRAPADGRMRYVRSAKYGLCAIILADTGARYLITGLGSTLDRRVTSGEIIGKTARLDSRVAIAAATALLGAAPTDTSAPTDAPAEAPAKTKAAPYTKVKTFMLTVNANGEIVPDTATATSTTTKTKTSTETKTDTAIEKATSTEIAVATGTWPTRVEVLLAGLPLATVIFLLGAPLIAVLIGSATLVIAVDRPK
jgi:hypothetical protein